MLKAVLKAQQSITPEIQEAPIFCKKIVSLFSALFKPSGPPSEPLSKIDGLNPLSPALVVVVVVAVILHIVSLDSRIEKRHLLLEPSLSRLGHKSWKTLCKCSRIYPIRKQGRTIGIYFCKLSRTYLKYGQ